MVLNTLLDTNIVLYALREELDEVLSPSGVQISIVPEAEPLDGLGFPR